jgi:hypothetical protein
VGEAARHTHDIRTAYARHKLGQCMVVCCEGANDAVRWPKLCKHTVLAPPSCTSSCTHSLSLPLPSHKRRWEVRPRAVRINYKTLGVDWPWVTREAWQELAASRCAQPQEARSLAHAPKVHVIRGWPAYLRAGLCATARNQVDREGEADADAADGALLRVRVEVLGRGVPRAHAAVSACAAGSPRDAGSHTAIGHGLGQRGVLGYLTAGWYDSARGRGVGMGFVSAAALRLLALEHQPDPSSPLPLCLDVNVRNPTSVRTIQCRAFVCC